MWFEQYKIMVTIGYIIVGAILTFRARKGSGAQTLGIILLIFGLVLLIYCYVF